ncbi:MAG: hypothetical protein JWM47_3136, partial [Acidimicrobiales bacterium]|nr:hypothetical protein [Acidimicrobiales bacterium]
MATPEPAAPAPAPPGRWLPAMCGLLVGLVVVGPGLGPGILLNLDLTAPEEFPMPPGVWGLGPSLTQRVPLGALEAMASTVLGGPLTVKALIVATIAVAYAGLERLARPASVLARHGAALAYAAGPYVVTRAAVGHLNVSWAAAVIPWVLPTLLRPSEQTRRTFVALLLLGLGGTASAVLGLAVAAVGLIGEAARRPAAVAGWATLASLPWLLPNAVVLAQGAAIVGAHPFRTDLQGVGGPFELLAGGGFWVPASQVGGRGVIAAAAGLVVAVLAAVGWSRLAPSWRRPALAVAVAGLVLAAASAVPGARAVWGALAEGPLGAPLREGQRFLLLWLVVALPAAAHGADRLAARASTA